MQDKIDEAVKQGADKKPSAKPLTADPSIAGGSFMDPETENLAMKITHPGGDTQAQAIKNKIEDPMDKPKIVKPDEA